jgi:hypothetical protein
MGWENHLFPLGPWLPWLCYIARGYNPNKPDTVVYALLKLTNNGFAHVSIAINQKGPFEGLIH